MKKYYLLSLLMVCMFAFSSCSDDDDKDQYKPFVPTASNGAYVMNQGSYYSKISSTIGYLDYGTQALTDSVFVAANGFLPGNTLQGGAGTITLEETAGTMTVTQASAAAMAAANGLPAANVTSSGTPTFGVAPCTLP